ncbi:hypothetical protein J3A83DRAFT_4371223 [Scleroderma citrinum]
MVHLTGDSDVAYSLLGTFNLHISVLYGGSAENALKRLLAEVISKSGDTSILDWVGQSSTFHSYIPATISSSRSPPFRPSSADLTTPPPVRSVRKLLVLRSARKVHQALSSLSHIQFVNFRLILLCIIHCITTITLARIDSSAAAHVHQIRAAGLEPIEIVLSRKLENIVPYILIRPWH